MTLLIITNRTKPFSVDPKMMANQNRKTLIKCMYNYTVILYSYSHLVEVGKSHSFLFREQDPENERSR